MSTDHIIDPLGSDEGEAEFFAEDDEDEAEFFGEDPTSAAGAASGNATAKESADSELPVRQGPSPSTPPQLHHTRPFGRGDGEARALSRLDAARLADEAGVPKFIVLRSGARTVEEALQADAESLRRSAERWEAETTAEKRRQARRARRWAKRSTGVWHKAQTTKLPVEEKDRAGPAINADERNAIYGPCEASVDLLMGKRWDAKRRGIGVDWLPSVQDLDLDAEERKNEEWHRDWKQAAENAARDEQERRRKAGLFRPKPPHPPVPSGRSAQPRRWAGDDRQALAYAGFGPGENGFTTRKPRMGRKAKKQAQRFTNVDGKHDYRQIGNDEDAIRDFLTRDGRAIADYVPAIKRGRRSAEATKLRDELALKVRELVERNATQKAIAVVLDCDPKTVKALLDK